MRVVQSWDDGCVDDIRIVDILRRHEARASFCLNAGLFFNERGAPWSHKGREIRRLARREVVETYAGFDIVNHGLTHANLTEVSDDELTREVVEGRDELARLLGRAPVGFCYPFGAYDERSKEAVRAAGHAFARTTTASPAPWPVVDTLELHPSCWLGAGNFWEEYEHQRRVNGVFSFWSHSYDLATADEWACFELAIETISRDPEAQWCTLAELVEPPPLPWRLSVPVDAPAPSSEPSPLARVAAIAQSRLLSLDGVSRRSVARAVTSLDVRPPSRSYREFGAEALAVIGDGGVLAVIWGLVATLPDRVSALDLPAVIQVELAREGERLALREVAVDLDRDADRKDLSLAAVRMLSVGALYFELDSRPGPALATLGVVDSKAPWLQVHVTDAWRDQLTSAGLVRSYRRLAAFIRRNPGYGGVFGTSWLFDEGAPSEVPHVGFFRRVPEDGDACLLDEAMAWRASDLLAWDDRQRAELADATRVLRYR